MTSVQALLRLESAAQLPCPEMFSALFEGKDPETILKMKVLLDALAVPVFVKGADLRYTLVNAEFERVIGYTLEEVRGKTAADLVPAHQAANFRDHDVDLIQNGGTQHYEAKVTGTGGQIRDVIFHKTALARPDGSPAGIVGVILDITEERAAREREAELNERLANALRGTIDALVGVQEARDPYTTGHQNRVSRIALAIGEELGLAEERLQDLETGARVHDIGKLRIPQDLLTKSGALTPEEFALVKTHSMAGFRILSDASLPHRVLDIVLHHHERWDGSGYPNGLVGNSIALEAQIIGVADTLEAVTSHRPYRPGRGIDYALKVIRDGRGTAFNPDIVDACLRLVETGRLGWLQVG